ncbi:MAG TPA: hypothetical protein VNI82_00560 [Candidatus Nitrosotenuis sp.]|nr:hypothetical protein [Candidatus Nitrosotenuis sp.]
MAIIFAVNKEEKLMDLFDETLETSWLDEMIEDVKKQSKKKKPAQANA